MARYFFDTIAKTIVVFASEFRDIVVHRQAKDGTTAKIIPVEIILGNKETFQKRLLRPNRNSRISLPAIAIDLETLDYNPMLQKNPQFSSKVTSRQQDGIVRKLGAPSPYNFIFKVVIRTKMYSDMRQILETILPMYQPKVTRRINLIPEFDLSVTIPIILESVATTFDSETDDSADSLRSLEAELSFRVESYVFPPIEEQHIAKQILAGNMIITGDKSPSDIVKNNLISVSGLSSSVFKTVSVETKSNAVYRIDASDVIAGCGEFFSMRDKNGDIPFVFEYDNGECYGKDFMVPESLAINKTGAIYFRANHAISDELPETWKAEIWTKRIRNHEIAQNVFHQYVDFNYKTMRNLRIERTREIDKAWIDEGMLWLYSPLSNIDTMQKVFNSTDYSDFEEFLLRFELPVFEEDEEEDIIVCGGLNADREEFWIETDSTVENGWQVKTRSGVLDSFVESGVTEIRLLQNKIFIGNKEIETSDNYFMFWIGTNGSQVVKYDVIRGY